MKAGLQKRINHAVGKAIHEWSMIADNDRIVVGVSGGKDSQALVHILFSLQKRAPVKFEILPVHIDAGYEGSFAGELEDSLQQSYGPMMIEYTDHGVIAHSDKNTENPCFLCSRLRRKRLFEIAKDNNCTKIALGHHKDDIIETLFINIFYSGKIGTMKPRQSFFNGALDIIRPLAYVEKEEVSEFCKMIGLKEFKNNCPSADKTKRSEVREMLESIYKTNKHIKGNIFRAMSNIASDYLLNN